jgi:hypothetical protein
MASDTGGNLARGSNDLSLAVGRARRDLGCRYTLGFYDKDPKDERQHTLRVRVNRAGLRIVSPTVYAFRSRENRRASLLTAAYIAPDMFQNGVIRTHVFPTRPAGRHTWECTVAVEFPVPFGAGTSGSVEREFGVVIRSGPRLVTSFDRKVTVRFRNAAADTRRVSFSQPVTLQPGEYTVTAIMTAPGEERPYTSSTPAIVPAVPREDLFLVSPVLGKRAAGDVVVKGSRQPDAPVSSDEQARHDQIGDADSFMPLLVQTIDPADRVLGMTRVCAEGRPADAGGVRVRRSVDAEAGSVAFGWPDEGAEPAPGDGVACRTWLDQIPPLPPGEYLFRASLQRPPATAAPPLEVPFTLVPPAPVP